MYAYLKGETRRTEYTYSNAEQLASLQAKFGDRLVPVGGNAALPPAAVGITKPDMAQGELPKVRKGKVAPEQHGNAAPPIPEATLEKKMRGGQGRPVVNISKGTYFASLNEAALSVSTPKGYLCSHLTKAGKIKPRVIKGNVFRYATEQEVKRAQAMVTDSERASLPSPHANSCKPEDMNKPPKPIVCINNGQYYPSQGAAAKALGLIGSMLSDHLRPTSKKIRTNVHGYVFRYATPEEMGTHSPSPGGGRGGDVETV